MKPIIKAMDEEVNVEILQDESITGLLRGDQIETIK